MKKALFIVCLLMVFGFTPAYASECSNLIQQMNALWCEDAALVGFTAAYLGHDEWKKLTDAFNEARAKSAYGPVCKTWNGHWYGRRIQREQKEIK